MPKNLLFSKTQAPLFIEICPFITSGFSIFSPLGESIGSQTLTSSVSEFPLGSRSILRARMARGRLKMIHDLYRSLENRDFSYLLRGSRSYSSVMSVPGASCLRKDHDALPWTIGCKKTLHSVMAAELSLFSFGTRLVTTQAKAPSQMQQMGSFKVSMLSPGIIYEPYAPREPISFWRRWVTRSGWRRTKEDIILELKSAYAIAKLRKHGYSRQQFYKEAVELYKEINTLIATRDKSSLRKAVTENMYSALKNEIKHVESKWSRVYWEMVEPVVKIRTLRARLIGIDRSDLNKVFIQLTLEFLTKQKFEAYDAKGTVVAGDKTKEMLIREIWVFEKSLFHSGAYWRLCGRIPV